MTTRPGEAPFRVVLDGAGQLEDLPVREITAWLDGLVSLVAQGSAHVLGKPSARRPGRRQAPIEQASQIRLASLNSGSVVADLLPAKPAPLSGSLDLTAESLSERAISTVMDVAEGHLQGAPELAEAFLGFCERFVGARDGALLRFEDRRPDSRRDVVVDTTRLKELRRSQGAVGVTEVTSREIVGQLYEANTETQSAMLRVPSGRKVDVRWSREHQPEIKRLLGGHADLRGDVAIDPTTHEVRSVQIRQIISGQQLGLDLEGVDFWTDVPATVLAAELHAAPVRDPAELELAGPSADEWAALYETLRRG